MAAVFEAKKEIPAGFGMTTMVMTCGTSKGCPSSASRVMDFRPLRVVALAAAMVLCASALFAQKDFPLPPPQIASAAGKPAPEFRLKDQDYRFVTLSSFRGSKVLLMFYRGYW